MAIVSEMRALRLGRSLALPGERDCWWVGGDDSWASCFEFGELAER